jgi:hypothetical protein
MRPLAFLIGLFSFGILFAQNGKHDYRIKVSDKFIYDIESFDYKTNPKTLISEYFKYLSLRLSSNDKTKGILVPIEINLDEDAENEIISIIGWDETQTYLGVFKQIDNTWYIIYTEPINMFYTPPELSIINNPSKNKTFYIRQLNNRGSGIYSDSYHFYKLIDKKVYQCLSLIHDARIYGWGLFLNQDVSMQLKPSSGLEDELSVIYDYNFFPGSVMENDSPWPNHSDISFVKDKQSVSYIWDDTCKIYKALIYTYDHKLLNEDKIKCFGNFGNDSLFIRAFNYELDQKLDTGSDSIKQLIKKYIFSVKKDGKAMSPNGSMEEKTKIGNARFFGPTKKQ